MRRKPLNIQQSFVFPLDSVRSAQAHMLFFARTLSNYSELRVYMCDVVCHLIYCYCFCCFFNAYPPDKRASQRNWIAHTHQMPPNKIESNYFSIIQSSNPLRLLRKVKKSVRNENDVRMKIHSVKSHIRPLNQSKYAHISRLSSSEWCANIR